MHKLFLAIWLTMEHTFIIVLQTLEFLNSSLTLHNPTHPLIHMNNNTNSPTKALTHWVNSLEQIQQKLSMSQLAHLHTEY
jgi:hypothetical protein